MSKSHFRNACLCLAAVSSLLFACTDHPRFGAKVASTRAVQTFDGYVPAAGGTVTVQAQTYSNQNCNIPTGFVDYQTITANTTPDFTDACGIKWYRFSHNFRLKNDRASWCLTAHEIFYQAEYRLMFAGAPLPSFSEGVENTCHPSKSCIANVVSECGGVADGVSRLLCMIGDPSNPCTVAF